MAQRQKDIKYFGSDKGKLTRKVSHFKERFPKAESERIRKMILLNIGKQCRYCATMLTLENISADHHVSLKNGGKSDESNLSLICKVCNRAKGDFNADCFLALLEEAEKFGERNNLYTKLKRASMVFGRRF